MKNIATKVCVTILILCFFTLVAAVMLAALGREKEGMIGMAGNIAGIATALCAVGWVLAMRNLRLADEGDFSSEGQKSKTLEKLLGDAVPSDLSPVEDSEGISDSEWL